MPSALSTSSLRQVVGTVSGRRSSLGRARRLAAGLGALLLACSDGASGVPDKARLADVVRVSASGAPGAYTFEVTISSPDAGCELYADWWEVLSAEGKLIYRRILGHSHAAEQPFTRAGGPVAIGADEVVWVRAHMHPGGYGGEAARGSVGGGFERSALAPEFASAVERLAPLPEGCAY
jgi:hypothetical protein